MLDGGVHNAAAIRLLLEAAGEKITKLSSFNRLIDDDLPPLDTVVSILSTEKGASGTFVATWASPAKGGLYVEVVMSNGVINASPVDMDVKPKDMEGKVKEETFKPPRSSGVPAEVQSFAKSIQSGQPDPRASPQEALEDLRVVEMILRSGEASGKVMQCT